MSNWKRDHDMDGHAIWIVKVGDLSIALLANPLFVYSIGLYTIYLCACFIMIGSDFFRHAAYMSLPHVLCSIESTNKCSQSRVHGV